MEQKLRIDEDRLEKTNKGNNFFNLEKKENKYYIDVILQTTQNLQEKEEKINVETNLNGLDFCLWRGISINEFLKELEHFSKKPLIKVRTTNRKNKLSYWDLREIRKGVRGETLKFSDITISIGELAKKKLKIDFQKRVEEILALQKSKNNKQELVDRYVSLREKMLVLETIFKAKREDYSYCRNPDKTIKLTLQPIEYNKKLKAIEVEMRDLSKKLNIENRTFDYQKVQKKLSYKEWVKFNEVELDDNWGEIQQEQKYRCDDEEDDVPKSFEEYAKFMYKDTGGLIEVEWKDG